jgi:hypothetical protein
LWILVNTSLVRKGCVAVVILPGASPAHPQTSTPNIREVAAVFTRPKLPQRFYPSQRKRATNLRATTKEAQATARTQHNHPPLSTSLPPHKSAKMLLGMKKFPVKVGE